MVPTVHSTLRLRSSDLISIWMLLKKIVLCTYWNSRIYSIIQNGYLSYRDVIWITENFPSLTNTACMHSPLRDWTGRGPQSRKLARLAVVKSRCFPPAFLTFQTCHQLLRRCPSPPHWRLCKKKNQNSCTALMMTSVVRKRLCTHIHKSSWCMSTNNSLVTAEKNWCLSNLMSFPEEICWFAVLNVGEFSLFLINLFFFSLS